MKHTGLGQNVAIKIFEEILERCRLEKELYSIENREKDFAIISFEGLEKVEKNITTIKNGFTINFGEWVQKKQNM